LFIGGADAGFPWLKKLNAPANLRIGVKAHDLAPDRKVRSLAHGMERPFAEGAQWQS